MPLSDAIDQQLSPRTARCFLVHTAFADEELPPLRQRDAPICKLSQLIPGFNAWSCKTVRPLSAESFQHMSPDTMVCVLAQVTCAEICWIVAEALD